MDPREFIEKYDSILRMTVNNENSLDEFFCRFAYCFGNEFDVKIYLVGGFVRDKIMGLKSKDIDVDLTNKTGEFSDLFVAVCSILYDLSFKSIQTSYGQSYQINCGDMKPAGYDINFMPDIIKAISEADFTMNGLAIDITPKVSPEQFLPFVGHLIYTAQLDRRYYDFLLYPDPIFLQDAVERIVRLTPFCKKQKAINIGPRALKFFERSFEDYQKMGFKFEDDTYKYLLLNSGYIGLLKRRGFLSAFFRLVEKGADPEIQSIIQLADHYRKETTGGKGLQDFITFLGRFTTTLPSQDKIQQAFFISLRPLFARLEEFFFGSETAGKTLNLFQKFLTRQEIDYYGLDAIKEVYDHVEQDPKLIFIKETVQDIGKATGTLIKVLNGTGKWLEDFKGDHDERIYNCIKIFNEQSKVVTSIFEYFNIENLRFLKISDRDPFLQADIRLAAMLADIRQEQIDSQINSLKITSTLKDFDRSFIATIIKTIRILAIVSYSYADIIRVRRFGLALCDLVQRLLVTKGLLIDKNKIIDELLEDAWRIINACMTLKETKYANPVFTDIKEGDLAQARRVLEEFLFDTEQIKYFTDNYYPLTIKEIQQEGLAGKEIGNFVKIWKTRKLETVKILNYQEALEFLHKYASGLKTGIAA